MCSDKKKQRGAVESVSVRIQVPLLYLICVSAEFSQKPVFELRISLGPHSTALVPFQRMLPRVTMDSKQQRYDMQKACVLGSGAFGTALAQLMARQGVPTTAWTRSQDITDHINK